MEALVYQDGKTVRQLAEGTKTGEFSVDTQFARHAEGNAKQAVGYDSEVFERCQ